MPTPGVYIFYRNSEPLYIGSTRNLAIRPIKRDRAHVSRWSAILQSTSTKLLPCSTHAEALQLESHLINSMRPKYNLRHPHTPGNLDSIRTIIYQIEDEIETLRQARHSTKFRIQPAIPNSI